MARILRTLLRFKGQSEIRNFSTATVSKQKKNATSTNTLNGIQHEMLEVPFGNKVLALNSVWLRENCQSAESFNRETNQRNILYYTLNTAQTSISSWDHDSESLRVFWKDGHQSHYRLQWLADNSFPGAPKKTPQFLWNAMELENADVPRVEYESLVEADEEKSLTILLETLLKYGIGLVKGVPPTMDATQQTVQKVCYVQETLFGKMWGFTSDMARGDTAYTNISLGAHTDTTYLALPAGIQVFHCLYHDGDGGETLLVDGFRTAEDLRVEDLEAFKLLATEQVHHHYIEPGHHTESLDTILKIHPVTQEMIMLRYNHYDRSPIRAIEQSKLVDYYDALAHFSHLMTRPSGEFWIKLEPGTAIFVDNWRVLHGRAGFTGLRKMCGCYLPRDDWVSKARILGLV